MNNEKLCDNIVKAIETDILDRSGLGNEWEQISEYVQQEIRDTWKDLILKELAKVDDN